MFLKLTPHAFSGRLSGAFVGHRFEGFRMLLLELVELVIELLHRFVKRDQLELRLNALGPIGPARVVDHPLPGALLLLHRGDSFILCRHTIIISEFLSGRAPNP